MSDRRWIQTYTGKKFDPFGPPALWEFDVRDLAHHLSLANRYAGATRRAYSVAEHSWRVSCLAGAYARQHLGFTEDGALWVERWGLVHDAPEAYLGDVAAPVKKHPAFAFYREAEHKIMAYLAEWLRLPGPCPDVVDLVDKWIPRAEVALLMCGGPTNGWTALHPDIPGLAGLFRDQHFYAPYSAREAEDIWLDNFARLFPEHPAAVGHVIR